MINSRSLQIDSSFRYIIPAVILLHFLAALWLAYFSAEISKPAVPQKIVVTTIALNPKSAPVPKKEPFTPSEPQKIEISQEAPQPEPIVQEPIKQEPVVESIPVIEQPAPLPRKSTPPPPVAKPLPKQSPKPVAEKIPTPKPPPPKANAKPKKSPATPQKKSAPKPAPNPRPVVKKQPIEQPKKTVVKQTPKESVTAPPSVKKVESNAAIKEAQKIEAERVAFNTRRNNLLRQAKEKIGKIDLTSGKLGSASEMTIISAVTPSRIDSLSIDKLSIDTDSPLTVKEAAYKDELRFRLKLLLKLPEYGDVKLKLTLDRQGTVVNLKIISAASALNREYIEKNLPKQSLPPFGANFPGVENYSFTITMSNE